MKYIFLFLSICICLFSQADSLHAETATGTEVVSTSSTDATPLSIISVEASDKNHVQVTFSEGVKIDDTLKFNIQKQSDNSTIAIESTTGSSLENVVIVTLESDLAESTAYTLTIVSAMSQDGSVIQEGALAIKNFATSVFPPEDQEEIPSENSLELNAPTNPTAVTAEVTSLPTPSSTQSGSASTGAQTATGTTPVPTSELPLTGMNPLFLFLIAIPLALIFLRKRA